MNRYVRRVTAGFVILGIAGTVRAELIAPSSDRERIAAFLDRNDVAGGCCK